MFIEKIIAVYMALLTFMSSCFYNNESITLFKDETCYSKEIEILLRITEATDGTVEQKKNVISCIMNRVYSPEFPDTIEGVVFQKGQFSPITDGRYYLVEISQSTIEAYEEYKIEGLMHNCLFFCTPTCSSYKSGWFSTLKESFQDGMHAYFTGEKK